MCQQDVVLLQFNEDWFNKNRLIAWAREKLKLHGIVGLNEAPYFCRLLERLPTFLQVQHSYEKVSFNLLKLTSFVTIFPNLGTYSYFN